MVRWRSLAFLVIFVAALGACGDDQPGAGTASPPWVHAELTGAPPDRMIVPGPAPPGLSLAHAYVAEPVTEHDSRMVLFGRADLADPADGKQIVVGSHGSDVWGLIDPARCVGEVGSVRHCRQWSVIEQPDPRCMQDCFDFVMGREVTDDELRAVADAADFTAEAPVVDPAVLPAGVTKLVTAPLSLTELKMPAGEVITYIGGGGEARLSVAASRGGRHLALLSRFFLAPDGRVAPFAEWWGEPAFGSVRVDGETVTVVLSGGIDGADHEAFADSLRRDDGGEWEKLRTGAADLPVEQLLPIEGPDPIATVSGRYSAGRWGVGLEPPSPDGRYHVLVGATGPEPLSRSQSSGGGFQHSGDAFTAWSVLASSGHTNFVGRVLAGIAPASVATVDIDVGDRSVAAVVGDGGALPDGDRLWAAFLEGAEHVGSTVELVVVARDADGREIGRAELAPVAG